MSRAGSADVDAPILGVEGLVKSWPSAAGRVKAVGGIDPSIASGQVVALLGPNGAGKSTTIDMVLGLAAPDGGSVSILGRTPRAAVADGLVGAMLQRGEVIRDLSVRELIAMIASIYPRPMDVEQVIDLAGLQDAAEQRTQKLSGGQAQRARFALALASDPELLILDEPTVAMDVEARRGFWSAMRRFVARGRTVLFATHYLEEADANADRVVLMAHGRIVADGATTEIKARVGTHTIRATLPSVGLTGLASLPGVISADRHGEAVILVCIDSDAALRELLRRHPAARDIEVSGAGLEDAFRRLTGDEEAGSPAAPIAATEPVEVKL
ncbi:MAG TPA: ABC transporter ATP-binding protein [Solirubrobacteraceae bacterium]|nr:ABC transporter ATP-binding protein [Solirubrobacteraceae bacterium]